MKFIALLVALAGVFPMSLLLRSSGLFARLFWIIFGMLPFFSAVFPMFDIGLISWGDHWVGFVYSLEITIVDILALAAFFALPGRGLPWWCKLPTLFFVIAAGLSMLNADEPTGAFFGVWQFIRMAFVMAVVGHACRLEPRIAIYILLGMSIGMGSHLVAVLQQRFILGVAQAHGLFLHQNTLGMAAHMVLYPNLALLLYGYQRWWLAPTVAATVIVVVLTASRATVGFAAFGVLLTFLLLALSGLTQRKMMFVGISMVALAIIGPLTFASFQKRFAENPLNEEQYDERAAFNRTAAFILADHPGGIGSNHYVHVAKNFGYSSRAGVLDSEVNRRNIVHNAYWLTAAETGYLGLATYLAMLAAPLACAFAVGWRERGRAEGALLLGFGVALLIVYVHSNFEWIVFTKDVQYPLFTTMGMTFGIVMCLNDLRRAARDRKRSGEPARPAQMTLWAAPGWPR